MRSLVQPSTANCVNALGSVHNASQLNVAQRLSESQRHAAAAASGAATAAGREQSHGCKALCGLDDGPRGGGMARHPLPTPQQTVSLTSPCQREFPAERRCQLLQHPTQRVWCNGRREAAAATVPKGGACILPPRHSRRQPTRPSAMAAMLASLRLGLFESALVVAKTVRRAGVEHFCGPGFLA